MWTKIYRYVNAIECGFHYDDLFIQCIFGKHVGGGFIAIVNWGVSAEISSRKNDISCNEIEIYYALKKVKEAAYLSKDEKVKRDIAHNIAVAINNIDGWLDD